MSKLNVQIKIWVGEGAIIKIKHASMTLLYIYKKPNMKTMQLRNQQTCMISVKNLCMKSSWD